MMHFFKVKCIWRRVQFSVYSFRTLTSVSSKHPFPVLPDTLNASEIKLTDADEKSQELLHLHENIKKICIGGGGEKSHMLHIKKNKILPREKIKLLFDDDSETLEICLQVGLGMEYGDIPGGSGISTIGKIHGKYCFVTANDGTLKGGTIFPISLKKSLRGQEISFINLLPNICLVDSGGAFLPLQSEIFPDKMHGGRAFYNQAVHGSKGVPQLALVCGSCTAGGAYIPMMCDDSGIVHKIGTIFLGGPPLVKAATGEEISAENLGGATLHCSVSGCSDYFASTEEEGFEVLRDVVATLDFSPISCADQEVNPLYNPNELDVICGLDKIEKAKLLGVIAHLVDESRFREFKQMYGRNLVTGYAFIDHVCVGIVANCGPLTYEDGIKGSHFAQICNQRNLPIIFLQNSGPSSEFWDSTNQLLPEESFWTLRGRAAMMSAISCAEVPKIAINIGGCHGDDNYTMCGPSFDPNFIFCWPGTETYLHQDIDPISSSKPPGKNDNLNKKKSKKPISGFNFPNHTSWYMASRALYDGIIAPSESRQVLSFCLRVFEQMKNINRKEVVTPMLRF